MESFFAQTTLDFHEPRGYATPMKTTITYYGIVYHGGSLLGLGSYGRTKSYSSLLSAERAAKRLVTKCSKICGGSPSYDIFEG